MYRVLILLWVEYGLGEFNKVENAAAIEVLILLWVEYGLGGLNGWDAGKSSLVLILLWVEYGLGVTEKNSEGVKIFKS